MLRDASGSAVILSNVILALLIILHILIPPGKGGEFDSVGEGNMLRRIVVTSLGTNHHAQLFPYIIKTFHPGRHILFHRRPAGRRIVVVEFSGRITIHKP